MQPVSGFDVFRALEFKSIEGERPVAKGGIDVNGWGLPERGGTSENPVKWSEGLVIMQR
jgi:hypothetical protein